MASVNRSKVTLQNGAAGEGVDVHTVESTERWSDFTLEDGTTLRMKMMVMSFIRVDNEYDLEGNPIYAIKGVPQLTLISVPEQFKKKK